MKFDVRAVMLDQMVEIPSGKIGLRDDRKNTQWGVEILAFLLGALVVSQDMYFAVTGRNPSVFILGKVPVESVSWLDAIDDLGLRVTRGL